MPGERAARAGHGAAGRLAVARFVGPHVATGPLGRTHRHLQRLERDLGISVEMLAIFIRFWLASTPQLPDSAQAASRAKAGERYDSFLEALGRRLAKGPNVLQEIGEDIASRPTNSEPKPDQS